MEDDDQKQLNTPTQEPEQPSEEAPKSSEPDAVGEAPQSEEVGVSEDTGVEQTHSEAQDTPQESQASEPSGASATDEVPTVKKMITLMPNGMLCIPTPAMKTGLLLL